MRAFMTVLFVILFLIGAWAFASWHAWSETDIVQGDEIRQFRVSTGERFIETYRNLAREGVVEPKWQWLALLTAKRPRCLQAGIHELPAEATPNELIESLCRDGREETTRVTTLEGWTRWHIADDLASRGLVHRERFLEITGLPLHLDDLGFESDNAEGYLFPDTYEFAPNASEAQIIQRFIQRFEQVWIEVLQDHPGALAEVTTRTGLTLPELIVVASVVEREAIADIERPRIAQVIYNRLEKDMPLQMDPTCIYGEDRYNEKPSPTLCRSNANAHSTYANLGLPPTPIANPGRASLEATLNPSGETSILYFVAKNDGSGLHAFSETFEQHERNVQRYLRGD